MLPFSIKTSLVLKLGEEKLCQRILHRASQSTPDYKKADRLNTDHLLTPLSFSGWKVFGPKVGRDHGEPHHSKTKADFKRAESCGVLWWPLGTSQLVHDLRAIHSHVNFQSQDQGHEMSPKYWLNFWPRGGTDKWNIAHISVNKGCSSHPWWRPLLTVSWWALRVLRKEMISVNPDSFILPYIEKH